MDDKIVIALIGSGAALIASIISGLLAYKASKKQAKSSSHKNTIEFLNNKIKILDTERLNLISEKDSGKIKQENQEDQLSRIAEFTEDEFNLARQILKKVGPYLRQKEYDELLDWQDKISYTIAYERSSKLGIQMSSKISTIPKEDLITEMWNFRKAVERSLELEIQKSVEKITSPSESPARDSEAVISR